MPQRFVSPHLLGFFAFLASPATNIKGFDLCILDRLYLVSKLLSAVRGLLKAARKWPVRLWPVVITILFFLFLRLVPIGALFNQNYRTCILYKFLPPRGFDPWTLGTLSRLIDE